MSIYGVGSSNASRITPQPSQLPLRDNGRAQTPAPVRPAALPSSGKIAPQQPANAAQQSVPVEPPAGTDPALWSVLSGEERAFFAKSGAMGPLTYGRALRDMHAAQMPASRGGRLDVKV